MVSSINQSSDDTLQLMMMQMMQNMSKADTDGTTGLSMEELSSIDTSKDVGGAAFLNSLKEQFSALDADGDGQLTTEEISNAKPPSEQMGPPPGINLEGDQDSVSNFFENAVGKASSFMEKMISTYKNSNLPEMISSLSSAV